jgi:DeoR/GlpR family transcriptional regulator of sugar metabolism
MNAEERQRAILEVIQARGKATTADLSQRFGVSEMTVRRDIVQLDQDGALRRVHGGAVRYGSGSFEPPFALRSRLNAEAKRDIAVDVAAALTDGQTVVLDGGTTGVAIAEALAGRDLTVCTMSLRVAEVLSSSLAGQVMLTGGKIRPGELSMVGPAAARTLDDHRFDVYVMTVSGADADAGLTEWNTEDAAVKRAALAVSARCIVACDSSKLGQVAFARICPLGAADLFVTDAGLSPEQRGKVLTSGVELHVA